MDYVNDVSVNIFYTAHWTFYAIEINGVTTTKR